MYSDEENLVLNKFNQSFSLKIKLKHRVTSKTGHTLSTSHCSNDDFSKYAGLLLAGSAHKSLIGSFDRLSKGYLTDSEALLKKSIESFFYQAYFHKNPEDARKWCIDNIKPNLNYYDLALKLDKAQFTNMFFPTDYSNFFTEYVYKVGYYQSNRHAHLDFDMVHFEMGLDNADPAHFASTLVLGPKYENKLMETILNRLIMFSMFQLSLILYMTNQVEDEEYKRLFMHLNALL